MRWDFTFTVCRYDFARLLILRFVVVRYGFPVARLRLITHFAFITLRCTLDVTLPLITFCSVCVAWCLRSFSYFGLRFCVCLLRSRLVVDSFAFCTRFTVDSGYVTVGLPILLILLFAR